MEAELKAALLKGVQLKHASAIHDVSAPILRSTLDTDNQMSTYHNVVLDHNVDEWFPVFKDLTFPTTFLPITVAEGEALKSAYEHYVEHSRTSISDSEQLTLSQLQDRLGDVIAAVRSDNACDRVLIKTSSRSPKDVIRRKLLQIYRKLCIDRDARTANERLACLMQAGVESLAVSSAAEAMFVLERSKRVCADMSIALEQRAKRAWAESLVVRAWVPLDAGMEFRGFVHQRRLTALSQYNYAVFYPHVVAQRHEISERIQRFYEGKRFAAPQLTSHY